MTPPGLSLLPTRIRKECEAQVLFVMYGAVSSTAPAYIGQNYFLPPRWIRTKSKRKIADYRFGPSLFDLP